MYVHKSVDWSNGLDHVQNDHVYVAIISWQVKALLVLRHGSFSVIPVLFLIPK